MVRFELAPDVVRLLIGHRQMSPWTRERGGLLFADPAYTDRVVITHATPPHRDDQATLSSLQLNPGRCQREVEDLNSKGLWFVGYWHTHPETKPQISGADRRAFTNNLNYQRMSLTAMLAIIVGNGRPPDCLSVYLVTTFADRLLSLAR